MTYNTKKELEIKRIKKGFKFVILSNPDGYRTPNINDTDQPAAK